MIKGVGEAMEIELPWIEKYRPVALADVVGQKQAISRLQSYVANHNAPNMMFSGPAGIGKTSAAVALAKELYGNEFGRNFLELNASDSRGIDVVRGQIKDFARTLAFNADFKIIFLDESDALTSDAQHALRRTMEKYTKTCRFILSCVTPDTKIVLPEEVEISIEEFMKRFEEKKENVVLTKNQNSGNLEKDQVICCIQQNPKKSKKKVFELTTNSGRKIKATADHLLLTKAGWKKVGALDIDDKLIVFPNLEGTGFEEDNRTIVNLNLFKEFLLKEQKEKGYKSLEEAKVFRELISSEKRKIINRAKELFEIIKNNKGLTVRENQIYEMLKQKGEMTRKQIQDNLRLSRIRTVQMLKQIEKKGYLKRIAEKNPKIHSFKIIGKNPLQLRNKMDIRNILEKEFRINISYGGIKKHLEKTIKIQGGFETSLEKLNEKGLLGIGYNDKRIGAFTRIYSFLFGDGHVVKNGVRLIFTGNKQALLEIKKDLAILGFRASDIQTKTLTNTIKGRQFVGKTTSFYLDSQYLVTQLRFLGTPVGDKVVTPYKIPNWVMYGTKFVKREFLRSLYGCEGYSPKIKHKNFEAVTLRMHKSRKLKQNMIEFYEQIKTLLEEFEVKSYIKIRKLGTKRKDGNITDSYELLLNSNNKNLFRFFSRVGYAFEKEKIGKSRLAAEYLRCKLYYLEQQKQKAIKILEDAGNLSKRALAIRYDCSADFVANQFKGKAVHLPRDFPNFRQWKKESSAGDNFVFNKVIEIKEIECSDVRDITCTKNHNFLANGIVSHNCNYSSRIIEPLQSRCIVFRFRPLQAKEIEERIQKIAKNEGIEVNKKALDAIVYVSMGDLRKAVNVLQASSALNKKVDEKTVFNVSSRAKPQEVKEMIATALEGKFMDARNLLDKLMYEHGMSGEDVISQVYREVMNSEEKDIPSKAKIGLVDVIGEYDFRLVEGANERVQLEAMLAQFARFGE